MKVNPIIIPIITFLPGKLTLPIAYPVRQLSTTTIRMTVNVMITVFRKYPSKLATCHALEKLSQWNFSGIGLTPELKNVLFVFNEEKNHPYKWIYPNNPNYN